MKKLHLFNIIMFLCLNGLNAQFMPTTRNLDIASSPLFAETDGGISGYIRGSVYGFGQDGGPAGSQNYDLATSFAEAAIRADFKKSTTEGYMIFKGEARLREGQYFNGRLNNTTGTKDMYKTTLELRDLYVGYRRDKWEVVFGNQNIQWGRGIGSNPTNNLSASNMMFLSANAEDTKMYNLMLNFDYKIHPNLDWQVVAIPSVKSSNLELNLFNLGGMVMGAHEMPSPDIDNGAIATRLNWNVGPIGASVSYFNGYDPFPTFIAKFGENGLTGNTVNYRKQTFGFDFGKRIGGKVKGDMFEPTNDWMIFGEFGYNYNDNPDDLAYIPLSNLSFSLSLLKQIYYRNNLDNFSFVTAWNGKYTPDFEELVPVDPNTDPLGFLAYFNKNIVSFFHGQQKKLDHGMMFVATQTFARKKVSVSAIYNYGLIKVEGDPSGHNSFFSPRVNWNISKMLSVTAGGMHMWGPSANAYGPIMGGYFAEMKIIL